jgi:hypothetical protein
LVAAGPSQLYLTKELRIPQNLQKKNSSTKENKLISAAIHEKGERGKPSICNHPRLEISHLITPNQFPPPIRTHLCVLITLKNEFKVHHQQT